MTEREDSKSRTLTINAVSIALVAAIVSHVFHESCHAVAVVLVGGRLKWFSLFGVSYVGEISNWKHMTIAGNAALMDILVGMITVALFSRRWVMQRPTLRLFLFYFGAYSLLSGLGVLVFDSFFYQPGEQGPNDWGRVLDLLGVDLAVSISIVVGAAGEMLVCSWLVDSTFRFGKEVADRRQRIRLAVPVLMIPYLVTNVIFTILLFWYRPGIDAIIMTWVGYIAFFLAFFGVLFWPKVEALLQDATPLPDQLSWPWIVGAAVALGIASLVLLPTIYF